MSKILYPIFKLPSENEDDVEYQAIPTWIKWWLLNNYNKKHSWVLSEIITGNPLTLENSVATKFYLPPLPRGNSEQVQYEGKNLLSDNFNDYQMNGETYGYIRLSENEEAMMLSLQEKDSSIDINGIYFGFTVNGDNSRGGIKWIISNGNVAIGPITNLDNNNYCKYISFYPKNEATFNKIFSRFNVMVEKGSTATAYEPYVGGTASPNPSYPQAITNVTGDVEVLVQNKNLVDISDDNSIIGSSAYNKFTINNQVIATTGGTLVGFRAKVKPNSVFTMQAFSTFSSGTTNQIRLREYSKYPSNWDDNYILQTNKGLTNNGIATQTVTTSATTEWVLVVIYASGSGCTISNIQLEQNTTATTYTPHQEQTFTFPLGTQRMYLGDYLADDGIHHVRKELVLDGSESGWIKYSDTEYYNLSVLSDSKTGSTIYGLCNRVNSSNGRITWDYLCKANSNMGIDIKYVTTYWGFTGSSLAEFKSWLAENPITVEYELATEEITPYTTEQQAYDEIKQAISYEEQTNISGSSDESNPIFEVQYYMKNESEGE